MAACPAEAEFEAVAARGSCVATEESTMEDVAVVESAWLPGAAELEVAAAAVCPELAASEPGGDAVAAAAAAASTIGVTASGPAAG